MSELWWVISDEDKIVLANYQWNNYKERLDAINEKPPKTLTTYPLDAEPEVDPELVREMRQAPDSPRYHDAR